MSVTAALPWVDRTGRLSPLRLATFVAISLPALWLAAEAATGGLGPRPITEANHQTGLWAVRFLLVTLAITPARRLLALPRLISVRRMLGLGVLAYTLLHFLLYIADQNFDLGKVASEIVLRAYLTVGFVGLVLLIALGATSTDAAIRRLGGGWHRLHALVHVIALAGILHAAMQAKIDPGEATVWAGLYLGLVGFRLAHRRGFRLSVATAAAIVLAAPLLTALVEAAWFALASGIPADRILMANLHPLVSLRPAWIVLAIGLATLALTALRGGEKPRRA